MTGPDYLRFEERNLCLRLIERDQKLFAAVDAGCRRKQNSVTRPVVYSLLITVRTSDLMGLQSDFNEVDI
jgi:hypothetical protein